MDYEILRDERFAHYSVNASDWQRAIRLDRLGKEYTPQEEQVIIPDMLGAIIPEEDWLRVQELRENCTSMQRKV